MKNFKFSEKGQTLLEYSIVLFAAFVVGLLILWGVVVSPIVSWTTVNEFDGQLVRYVPEKDSNALMVVKNLETDQNETFKNEDTLWNWKFNSRDYLALEEGKTYHFKVNWFRWAAPGFLGQSKNILEVTPLE